MMHRAAIICSVVCALGLASANAQQAASATLSHVQTQGILNCGIVREDAEYSIEDNHGSRGTFDDDLCKAFSVAALGTKAKLTSITFLDSASALDALRDGRIDVIASVSTDFSHSTAPGILLSPPVFYDGVGFLVPNQANVQHAPQLASKRVCYLSATTVESALRRWFRDGQLDFVPFPFQEEGEMEAAFLTGNCTAMAGDLTRLVNTRAEFGSLASQYAILPDVIAQDPLASATRNSDPTWSSLVLWVTQGLMMAQDLGLSSQQARIKQFAMDSPEAKLLGRTHELGAPFGLPDDWFLHVLEATGTYGDIYERAFGSGTLCPMKRRTTDDCQHRGPLSPLPLN